MRRDLATALVRAAGCVLVCVAASVPAWSQEAPAACQNECPTKSLPTFTVIHLKEVEPGICGIDSTDKDAVSDFEVPKGVYATWSVCSTCPKDATVELTRWQGVMLADILDNVQPPIGANNLVSLNVSGCGQGYVTGRARLDVSPGNTDTWFPYALTVQTGQVRRDYDPQLQIRGGGGLAPSWPWLLGLGGTVVAGFGVGYYVGRRRRGTA